MPDSVKLSIQPIQDDTMYIQPVDPSKETPYNGAWLERTYGSCIPPGMEDLAKKFGEDTTFKTKPKTPEDLEKALKVMEDYVAKAIGLWEATGPQCLNTQTMKACPDIQINENTKEELTRMIGVYNSIGALGAPAVLKLHDDIVVSVNQCLAAKGLPLIRVKLRAGSHINPVIPASTGPSASFAPKSSEPPKRSIFLKDKTTVEKFTSGTGVTDEMLGCKSTCTNTCTATESDCEINWMTLMIAALVVGVFFLAGGVFVGMKIKKCP